MTQQEELFPPLDLPPDTATIEELAEFWAAHQAELPGLGHHVVGGFSTRGTGTCPAPPA